MNQLTPDQINRIRTTTRPDQQRPRTARKDLA